MRPVSAAMVGVGAFDQAIVADGLDLLQVVE
jgi:hypothetical protein